jgi:polysaccharide transporter, PST family
MTSRKKQFSAIRDKVSKVLRQSLFHNALALYAVQACRKFLPIIALPYLARTLNPAGWGTVAFVSSLGEFMVMFIEFGFTFSATREVARCRDSYERSSQVVSGVLGCQFLLAAFTVTAVAVASHWIPVLRDNPALLCSGLLYGVFQGMNPIWFFQGIEKVRLAAAVEVTGKLLYLAGIFVWVRYPGDGWKALALQALPSIMTTITGIGLASRKLRLDFPTRSRVLEAMRNAWPLFVYRSGESLYGVGNAFILGLFAPAASVGYFAIADKTSRAIFGLLNPIREALYPRLSHLAGRSRFEAAKLARIGAVVMITGGVSLGAATYLLAPLLVHLLGSGGFGPATTVLRMFAVLPLLQSLTYSVGLQWLLPFGHDRVVNRIIVSGGLLNLVLAFLWAPRFAHTGMAWAVICSETFVCISMVWTVMRGSPFWEKLKPQHQPPPHPEFEIPSMDA